MENVVSIFNSSLTTFGVSSDGQPNTSRLQPTAQAQSTPTKEELIIKTDMLTDSNQTLVTMVERLTMSNAKLQLDNTNLKQEIQALRESPSTIWNNTPTQPLSRRPQHGQTLLRAVEDNPALESARGPGHGH